MGIAARARTPSHTVISVVQELRETRKNGASGRRTGLLRLVLKRKGWRQRWDSNPLRPVLQTGASTTSASAPKKTLLKLLKPCVNPLQLVPKVYTQNCTQTALVSPIYAFPSLPNLLKPRTTFGNGGFCRPLPYHLATAPHKQRSKTTRSSESTTEQQ